MAPFGWLCRRARGLTLPCQLRRCDKLLGTLRRVTVQAWAAHRTPHGLRRRRALLRRLRQRGPLLLALCPLLLALHLALLSLLALALLPVEGIDQLLVNDIVLILPRAFRHRVPLPAHEKLPEAVVGLDLTSGGVRHLGGTPPAGPDNFAHLEELMDFIHVIGAGGTELVSHRIIRNDRVIDVILLLRIGRLVLLRGFAAGVRLVWVHLAKPFQGREVGGPKIWQAVELAPLAAPVTLEPVVGDFTRRLRG